MESTTSEQGEFIGQIDADLARGRYAAALARLAPALERTPDDPDLLLARAAALLESDRYREARECAARAVCSRPPRAKHAMLLGRICFAAGDYSGAQAWFAIAVGAEPAAAGAHAKLAEALHASGRLADAAASYERALEIDSGRFDCLIGLGNCHLALGAAAHAERCFRCAIAIDGERAEGWRYLGVALDRADRETEAIAAHEHAVDLEKARGVNVGSFLGLASSLRDAGCFDEALAVLEPNLQRLPGSDAQLLYGHMLLTVGRLPDGWDQSEFRWMTDHFLARRPGYAQPVWAGQDLRGKTILLRSEQGMGDAIQFARYASLVKALGASVHLAVPRELANLARGIDGVDRILVIREDENAADFDYYIPLLSLPHVFGTDLASIPSEVPYLAADRERVARWAARFGSDKKVLRVGIVWGGNPLNAEDRFRSLPLQMLAPLAGTPGVRFYALQKGPREHEVAAPPPGLDIVDLGPEIGDFADTAAAITQLDLVISVCTSVAHLTGALGKPLWVMLHRAADWRWFTERSDSPWYPTATLFRQTRRGEWNDVVERVRAALEELAAASPKAVKPPTVRMQASKRAPPAPRPDPSNLRPSLSAVAETRFGILEYFPDDGAVGKSIGWYGEWLQPQVERLQRMIRAGSTVIEIEAGIGAHTLPLAASVGDAGQLIVYESQSALGRILRRNVAANNATAVTIMRRRLQCRTAGATRGSATETLDDLWLDRLDWLKISDAASVEDVLPGAERSLWRLRPPMHIGVVDAAAGNRWFHALQGFGYRCWAYETALFNPANFNRRPNDVFAGRTALAVIAIPEEVAYPGPLDDCIELS